MSATVRGNLEKWAEKERKRKDEKRGHAPTNGSNNKPWMPFSRYNVSLTKPPATVTAKVEQCAANASRINEGVLKRKAEECGPDHINETTGMPNVKRLRLSSLPKTLPKNEAKNTKENRPVNRVLQRRSSLSLKMRREKLEEIKMSKSLKEINDVLQSVQNSNAYKRRNTIAHVPQNTHSTNFPSSAAVNDRRKTMVVRNKPTWTQNSAVCKTKNSGECNKKTWLPSGAHKVKSSANWDVPRTVANRPPPPGPIITKRSATMRNKSENAVKFARPQQGDVNTSKNPIKPNNILGRAMPPSGRREAKGSAPCESKANSNVRKGPPLPSSAAPGIRRQTMVLQGRRSAAVPLKSPAPVSLVNRRQTMVIRKTPLAPKTTAAKTATTSSENTLTKQLISKQSSSLSAPSNTTVATKSRMSFTAAYRAAQTKKASDAKTTTVCHATVRKQPCMLGNSVTEKQFDKSGMIKGKNAAVNAKTLPSLSSSSTAEGIKRRAVENRATTSNKGILRTAENSIYSRKSVTFNMPNTESPYSSPSLNRRLSGWLKEHDQSAASYRHLRCFGLQLSDMKEQEAAISSAVAPDSSLCKSPEVGHFNRAFAGRTPLKERNSATNIDAEPNKVESKDTDESALKELLSLVRKDYPHVEISRWLDEMYEHKQHIGQLAIYWVCRAAVSQKSGCHDEALRLIDRGIAEKAQPNELLTTLRAELDVAAEINTRAHRRGKSLVLSVIDSATIIKYMVKDMSFGYHKAKRSEENAKVLVTPVRRSRRISRNSELAGKLTPLTPISRKSFVQYVNSVNELPEDLQSRMIFVNNSPLTSLLESPVRFP